MRILVVPTIFSSMMTLKVHIERHHGQYAGDMKSLRTMVKEHAAMHDADEAPTYPRAVPHLHENVRDIHMKGA